MAWNFNGTETVSLQIARILRDDILSGKYQPGVQVPPVRQIAQDAAVNPNTVQKALTMLENEGLLCSNGTIGRFVTSDIGVIESAKEKIRREYILKWLSEAKSLGISTAEMIEYIKKEDEKNERSRA